LARCRLFLLARDRAAARRASQVIDRQFALLQTSPDIGRPVGDVPGWRELIIRFGDSGYVALYRHDPAADAVYVLAFRHQKEGGY
jgi:plasmid stabilization system protein ParE